MKTKQVSLGKMMMLLWIGAWLFVAGCENPILCANFIAEGKTRGPAPLTIKFKNISVSAGEVINKFAYDFGDGGTSDSPNPTHTYLQPGKYTVTLEIWTKTGYDCLKRKDYIKVVGEVVTSTTTTVTADQIMTIRPLGDFKFIYWVNLADFSFIDPDEAVVLGWENDWENGLLAKCARNDGAEFVLQADGAGYKKFTVTNQDRSEWLWLEDIYELEHPLVIFDRWLNPEANPADLVIAFEVTSANDYRPITRPIETTTTTTAIISDDDIMSLQAKGDYQFLFKVNLADFSFIEVDEAVVLGWENDWEDGLKMDVCTDPDYAQIRLKADSRGYKKFTVTNQDRSEWLWLEDIYELEHPLVIPNQWLDPNANANELIIVFEVTGTQSFKPIKGVTY
jgi:hypothetical protein